MENDTSLALPRPAGPYRAGEERQHRVSNRGRPRTSHVEEKVMEFLEAIVEGMLTRSAAAIAQIPFETVRNWLSKKDPAFRPDFFRAFEKARAIAVHKNIKKLNVAKDWRAAGFWLERNVPKFARKQINKNISDEPGTNNGDASVDTLIIDPERMRKLSEAHDRFMRKLEAKAKEGESGSS